ncbi:hypothetical protein AA106555_2034 [Neokomagataea thailandica NBRC 106555]|uniref:Transposase n=1 Tax=Neokomagataea thailandica NBRC 106555 TaxID=1223520 RepID=A0ABQ0QSP3_9PROT|nr:hypothetical protein AA106555_2034 [Neokomagataea thailandica NBRC 106555]
MSRLMAWVGLFVACFRGEVLNEGAARFNSKQLHAAANAKHWYVAFQCSF